MLQDIIDNLARRVTPQQATTFGTIGLFLFTSLLVAALARLVVRIRNYRREGLRVPDIAKRDFWFLVGLGTPFVGLFIIRTFGLKDLGTNLWWLLGTTVLAVSGMFVWAYYEFRIIERDKDR